jgi:hypothetical protein
MSDRKAITKVFVERYRYAFKLEKAYILNEFIDYTGFNRHYAARVLRDAINGIKKTTHARKHKAFYDQDVKSVLEKLWGITDYICGKRFVVIIPELIRKSEQFHEFDISVNIKEKLEKISASTIDRILKPNRNNLGRKGTSMTKGTRYLIDRIPVKTFGEWKNSPAGFTQVDLVAHNGGNVFGGFLYTLDATDIHTSWTVCTLLQDKTMEEMLSALDSMRVSFPFPLRGIHSDNGSEFINDSVLSFADKHHLTFTRGRPYKKNDNPHVEQKNNSILRRNTGYLRYDKPEHGSALKELYGYLNLYVNYFQPTMILLEKHRIGAKAIRKYDKPKTPYQRVLESDTVAEKLKEAIRSIYYNLNPAELKRKINECQSRLIRMAAPIRAPLEVVKIRRKKEVKHTTPTWRREMSPTNPNPFLERQRLEEMRRATELVLSQRNSKKDGA